MAGGRPTSRKKILAAAADLARDAGPGSLSLDAVAHRAGVSKGGLLYNFPTKAKLMQALVEDYLAEFEARLDAATTLRQEGAGEDLLSAYFRLSAAECMKPKPGAAWIFAAMAEDPDFIRPIKAFNRRLLDRLKAETTDHTALLMTWLAVEGLRCLQLFGTDILTDEERKLVVSALSELG
jgi:AcrR family transcriptional regulator